MDGLVAESVIGIAHSFQAVLADSLAHMSSALSSSHVTRLPYLDYYCNAAHVSPTTWTRPPQAWGFELVHATVVMRHHARTPDNLFPVEGNIKDVDWDCSDVTLFNYAASPDDANSAPHLYRDTSTPVWHPFAHTFLKGTCQQGQLTSRGFHDAVQHGRDFWGVYHGRLVDSVADMYIRTSTEERTYHVVAGMLHGMGGKADGHDVRIHVQPKQIDSLVPSYVCPRADRLRSSYQSVPAWTSHLQDHAELKARLDNVLGTAGYSKFSTWYDPYFDIFTSRMCHGHPLPCNEATGECVSEKDAASVFEIGDFEYNYIWNTAKGADEYTRLTYGVMFKELALNLRSLIAGSEPHKARLYVGHDASIIRLISGLGMGKPAADGRLRWPALGSEVVFEVWRSRDEVFVRVLYGGKTVKSLEWVKASDFVRRLESNVPENLFELCNS